MAKIIAFDLGTKSIGIAKSSGFIPTPLTTIRFPENDFIFACNLLNKLFLQYTPDEIVVGLPKNMDGSQGHRVEMVEKFLDIFNTFFNNKFKVVKVDERLTTKMARSIMIEHNLSRKKQKENKDILAAVLILETYLNIKNRG